MAKTRTEIIDDIEDYIARNGGRFQEWYLSATGTPKATLFKRHGVRDKGDAWIARSAKDEHEARDVVDYFLGTRHTRGAASQGRETDLYVYAYKLKSHTKP
jgi:hypothetical protein